jgi:hypothetical protein
LTYHVILGGKTVASDIAKAIKAGKGKATLKDSKWRNLGSNDARKRFNYYR